MASAAIAGSMAKVRPAARSASQRCTAVSWAWWRMTKATSCWRAQVHTGAAGSAAASTPAIHRIPLRKRSSRASNPPGRSSGGTCSGSRSRPATMVPQK